MTGANGRGLLERLALHRPELRAWALYDWANSAMMTTIVAAVFPVYYYAVAGRGLAAGVATQRYALTTTLALATIAVAAPILGALGDAAGIRKRLLAAFMGLGVAATGGMFWIEAGDVTAASVLLFLALVGGAGSFIFYDALLLHVARPEEMDRASTTGYALGYLGGGLLLALQVAWIRWPAAFGIDRLGDLGGSASTLPVRLAFLSTAIWWLGFSIPLLRRVQEPPATSPAAGAVHGLARRTWDELAATVAALRRLPEAGRLLVAFWLYNDGVTTIIKMATIYATEIGIERDALLIAILVVQFVGIPASIAFGTLARRLGPRTAIHAALVVYCGIALFAARMSTAAHFFALAVAVGCVQGGVQALSRSLFASLVPRGRAAEFFAFFAVLEKFSGILGPALFAATIAVTGSSRGAVLSVLPFFVAGGLLLARVRVAAGRAAVRDAERA